MTTPKGPVQLSLEVSLLDDATFANYYSTQKNTVATQALSLFSANAGEQNIVIWGAQGCGLTHLLQACNHSASQAGFNIQYISLNEVLSFAPEMVFDGLDSMDLVCLDGLECIAGNQQWEQGLFHFYNRLRDNGRRLLMASHTSLPELSLKLPDLKSRVFGSVVYHIQALNDEDKAKALQLRAKIRGMDMPDEVARYILSRASRDNAVLFDLLNTLDKRSLQQQRKLTIPFVKTLLPQ